MNVTVRTMILLDAGSRWDARYFHTRKTFDMPIVPVVGDYLALPWGVSQVRTRDIDPQSGAIIVFCEPHYPECPEDMDAAILEAKEASWRDAFPSDIEDYAP